jgi:hypothetical protein
MRNIPAHILELLKNNERFVYCFKISRGDRSIYLTSNDAPIGIDEVLYYHHSGLSVEKSIFNDNAQNYIEISGVFEDKGIKADEDLTGYNVDISIAFPNRAATHLLLSYFCSKIIKDGPRFTMYLWPITNKLGQSLLEIFGPTCRATFGDHKCSINKDLYPNGTYCDKSFRTCCNKFNNAVNFRGEPFIPEGPL